MMNNSFTTTATLFIRKLIRMRLHVIKMGGSVKDPAKMADNCTFLQRQLDAYPYSDRTMSGFFIRNAVAIRDLIPVKHGSINKLTREYQCLYYQAQQIIEKNITNTHTLQRKYLPGTSTRN